MSSDITKEIRSESPKHAIEPPDLSDYSQFVTAIHSYVPQRSDEIQLRCGEKVKLLSRDSRHSGAEGWWVGQDPGNGNVGVFPSSYVTNPPNQSHLRISSHSSIEPNTLDSNNTHSRVHDDDGDSTDNKAMFEDPIQPTSISAVSHSPKQTSCSHPRSSSTSKSGCNVMRIPTLEIVQQDFIGSGAFGTVYRGLWRDQVVALKVFNLPTNQVDTEAAHLCRLSHRNVVKFFGVCELGAQQFPALVMEFAYGGALNMILSQHPSLGPLILLDWALQIAHGMAYLHTDARLCHRDLKSSNILIRERIDKPHTYESLQNRTLLITDFGMACRSSELVPQQSKFGTIAYAAPEVCRQDGFSFKSDTWSYGVVLWELLTMDTPFRSMEQPRLLFIIAMYNYTLHIPDGVPDLFVQLLTDCWSSDPQSRPNFEDIIERLESCRHCGFLDLTPEELGRIQTTWRELIAAHHKQEQESAAAALPSSITSGELSVTEEDLFAQLEMLRNERESLDRARAELAEKAYELNMKEEHCNRIMGRMGQQFMLLAVLAANQMKDPSRSIQTMTPKPPPPRKRPFVRSLFRRWGSSGSSNSQDVNHSTSSNNGPSNSSNLTSNRKASVGSVRLAQTSCTLDPSGTGSLVYRDCLNFGAPSLPSTLSRANPNRLGCSRGGIPLISPPSDMKHVVHVDPDWINGQSLCESTMQLFPSSVFPHDASSNYSSDFPNLLAKTPGDPSLPVKKHTSQLTNARQFHREGCTDRNCPGCLYARDRSVGSQSQQHHHQGCSKQISKSGRKFSVATIGSSQAPTDATDLLSRTCYMSVGRSHFFLAPSYPNPTHGSNQSNCSMSGALETSYQDENLMSGLIKTRLTASAGRSAMRRFHIPTYLNSRMTRHESDECESPPSAERRRSASGPVTSLRPSATYPRPPKSNHLTEPVKSTDFHPISLDEFINLVHLCHLEDGGIKPPMSNGGRSYSNTSAPVVLEDNLALGSELGKPSKALNSTVGTALWSAFRLATSFCLVGAQLDQSNTNNKSNSPADVSTHCKCSRSTDENLPESRSSNRMTRIPQLLKTHRRCKMSLKDLRRRRIQSEDRYRDMNAYDDGHCNFGHCSVCASYDLERQNCNGDGADVDYDDDDDHDDNGDEDSDNAVFNKNEFKYVDSRYLEHQMIYGDPHSPFLGMLAGSGRRATPSLSFGNNNNNKDRPNVPYHCLNSSLTSKSNYHAPAWDRQPTDSIIYPGLSTQHPFESGQPIHLKSIPKRRPDLMSVFNQPGHTTNHSSHPDSGTYDIETTDLLNYADALRSRVLENMIVGNLATNPVHPSKLIYPSSSSSSSASSLRQCSRNRSESHGSSYSQFSVSSSNPVALSRDAYFKVTQDGYLNRIAYHPCSTGLINMNPELDNPPSQFCPNYESHSFMFDQLPIQSPCRSDSVHYDNLIGPHSDHVLDSYVSNPEDLDGNLENVSLGGGPDEDRITLVPTDALESDRFMRSERKVFDDPLFENQSSGSQISIAVNNNTTPRTSLHRRRAIRERQKPPNLLLFRNRSLPSHVNEIGDSPPSLSDLYSSHFTNRTINLTDSQNGSASPPGPFVATHSTLL